jgi:hypothetical protein
MFAFAILIGIYSYSIFILGILNLLYPLTILAISIIWLISFLIWYKKEILLLPSTCQTILSTLKKQSKFLRIILCLLIGIWVINGIGVFLPETSFDALWYHLTLPKIFLDNNSFFYIPGGLFYYSLMPKLVDLLYIPSILLGNESLAKATHYLFGFVTVITLFNLSKKYVNSTISLLVVLIFSSNLVVGWLSSSAYIDLGRTFFELMSIYGIVLFVKEKKKLWLTESAVMLGFAIATKLIALSSLPVLLLFLWLSITGDLKSKIKQILKYVVISLCIPLPYFIFSYIQSGNPVYPLLSGYYTEVIEPSFLSIPTILSDFWVLFVTAPDPINPIYLISIPLLIILYKKFKPEQKYIVYICIAALIMWILTPRTGGGRFILPYLPVFSLLVGILMTKMSDKKIFNVLVGIIILVSVSTICYRSLVLYEKRDYLLGKETKAEYLKKNLNFNYGEFYDTDGYFKKNITNQDTVLVFGLHNLYYIDFPFIHESYAKSGDEFNYILTTDDTELPERFYAWKEIYRNSQTNVVLYSQQGNTWVY